MKKIFTMLFMTAIFMLPVKAETWVAADRVSTVGKQIISKNDLPSKTEFKVVDGAANNSNTSITNVIQISSTALSYAGNDNEVAAAIAHEMGQIINGKNAKDNFRQMAKNAITNSTVKNAASSEFVSNKISLADNKTADITAADLMIKSGYNPLAIIVWVTKMPGSTFEAIQGKPANSERAMNIYNYLVYNYPSKVSAGYNCQEYRSFLTYAEPIVKDRNSDKKKLAKFNKEQEKNKALRAKELAQYKATGGSGWDANYSILKTLMEAGEKR